MDQLNEQLSKLTVKEPNFKSVLYYELKFDKTTYDKIIDVVTSKLNLIQDPKYENLVVTNSQTLYKVNDEFHITILYTGGKEDKRSTDLNKFVDQQFDVKIEKIAYNDQFICIGVKFDDLFPYYGNPVKHITFGLNQFNPLAKKPLPKDSYLALASDNDLNTIEILVEPITVTATFAIKCR